MKLRQLSCAVLASLGVIASAHAAIGSNQSDYTSLILSPTAVEFGVIGQLDNATFGPSHFTGLIQAGLAGSYDAATGIYQFAGSDLSWLPPTAPDHTGLGVWAFKQVNSDLLIGNWATEVGTTKAADPNTYTVFYTGQNVDTAINSANYGAQATYNVSGLNNGDHYSGDFTANFGANATASGTLTGTLTDGTSTFDLGTASINNATAAISGSNASWTGGKTASNGVVEGQFFNTQAQLAGIAKFTDRQYDISFGGVKQ